jgi:hypothetical protein
MTEKLRDVLQEEAGAARVPPTDLGPVVAAGTRAVRRRRLAGSGAVAAGVALSVMLAPTVVDSVVERDDEPGIAGSGGFEARKVTYAQGSTIHYGDETIGVPHEVRSFVQTDDGFVFADEGDTVYFTNGHDTEAIGHAGAFTHLAADDSGSYVAWVEIDDGELPETVAYDTSTGTEVLRTSEGNGPGPGYYSDYHKPAIDAVDGETVYVHNAEGAVAVDISTAESTVIVPRRVGLLDVAGGRISRDSDFGLGVVVSAESGGEERRFPGYEDADLSPSGTRVVTSEVQPTQPDELPTRVFDTTTGKDLSPAWGNYEWVWTSQWIDDDTFAAYGSSGRHRAADLLRCSISRGECTVAMASVGSITDIRLPWGYDTEGS